MADEVLLRKIVKSTGEQVRMKELKKDDVFDVYVTDEDGKEIHEGRFKADEDPTLSMTPQFEGECQIMATPLETA